MKDHSPDAKFEPLLDYLRRTRGFDFAGYKRGSLTRRITRRMQMIGLEEVEDYLDFLEVHPEEFTLLFNTILINVTSFFRDPPAWDVLSKEVIPRLLAGKLDEAPIRVWSAGCSSGEEPYCLAIILAEALGEKAFLQRVKIYATDVDEEALNEARHASYSVKDLEPVPKAWREKYFEPFRGQFVFRSILRRSVIFGRNDLLRDAPISHADLLVCRNTLMYFNAEAQSQILARFHFALNDEGVIFLGKAEMLLTHANLFTPIDLKHRIFSKVPRTNRREQAMIMAQAEEPGAMVQSGQIERLQEAAFEVAPTAQIIVDKNGCLVLANEKARYLFELTPKDLGRLLQDLELSYRPVELRSLIDAAYAKGLPMILKEAERRLPGGEIQYLDVQVSPLKENRGFVGVSITFLVVTEYKRLKEGYERSKQELETAYEELQSTNEELETTNEELQSTVEELQTTNEELQSTNEEMETMNEELQSTNEELQTINDEMRQQTLEHERLNVFLESILSSVNVGVVVVDKALNVVLWNKEAKNLWGLPTEEVVGRPFLKLDIGLPLKKMKEPLKTFLESNKISQELLFKAFNRKGQAIQCRIMFNIILGPKKERQGVVLIMEEKN
jgi:two-component system, chemotaxis family, CheB/CheR fusion protein